MVDKLLREEEQRRLKDKSDEELATLAKSYAKQITHMYAGLLLELANRVMEHENSR